MPSMSQHMRSHADQTACPARIKQKIALLITVIFALPSLSFGAGQAYPAHPVRVVIGFPPGGAADILGRILAQKLAQTVNEKIIIDNRPGASSIIATEIVAQAPPDGYTLLLTASTIANNVGLKRDLPYNPVKDFAPVILIASTPDVLVAYPGLHIKTIPELIRMARAKPRQLNYGSGGAGSLGNLSGELLNMLANIKIRHVPYKGAGPAVNDVIAGHIQLLFTSLPSALTVIKSESVTPIAVTSAKRSASAPDIPAIAESGLAGYEATNWYGVMAPAGTPAPIITKIHDDFEHALHIPDTARLFARQGADITSSTPPEFARHLKSEITKWTKVIRTANIRVQ